MSSALNYLETMLFSPHRRTAQFALAAVLVAGALAAALLVAIAGPMYAPVAVLGVLGACLVLTDIRWGLVALFAVVGVLPFAALPFKLGFTPTFLDLALLAVYFVWITRIATRRQRDLLGSPLGVAVLIFLLMAVFAFVNGMRFGRPTTTTIRNFVELALGIAGFFVLVNNLRSRDDLNFAARIIMLVGAAAALIAIIFYVIPQAWTIAIFDRLARFNYPGGAGALRYIEDSPDNPMRAIGTQVDPNVLGGLMVLAAGLTAPQIFSPQPLFRRWIIALFLGAQLLALYLTYSRGSMLGLAAGLLVVGLLRYRKLLLLCVAGAALLLLLPQAQAYMTHLVEGLQLQDRATLMRLGEYKDAFALIARYPWFGVGFAGSPDADLYVGVSSLYLLMAQEMGLVGLATFLVVIAGFYTHLWRAWRLQVDGQMEALLLGIVAAVTGVAVGGLFDHYLFNLVYPHMTVLFWAYLALGMSAALYLTGLADSRTSSQRRRSG